MGLGFRVSAWNFCGFTEWPLRTQSDYNHRDVAGWGPRTYLQSPNLSQYSYPEGSKYLTSIYLPQTYTTITIAQNPGT